MKTVAFIIALLFGGVALAQTTQQVPDINVNPAAWVQILKFAVLAGVVSFLQDLHSWSKSNEPYEWKLALRRVLTATTGAILGAMGVSALEGWR